MRLKTKSTKVALLLASLMASLWPIVSYANPSVEELCERLYTDSLKKAKTALSQDKREEALRFLSDATAVLERCLAAPEEKPQRESKEAILALDSQLRATWNAL